MKILSCLSLITCFTASLVAAVPGHKGTLSLALTMHEEIGAYPATAAQKAALETKGGNYMDPVNPFGFLVPANGTQYYSAKTTPVGKITGNENGLTGTYTNEQGLAIKSTPYTNATFLADAVKAGRLTTAQATGAKLVTIRLTGNYDESRVYIFAEGGKTAPGPFFLGILDDRDLQDETATNYYPNINSDPTLLIVGQYGVDGYGQATVGRTQKIKSVLINDVATHTTTAAGGTTITGIDLKFFPNTYINIAFNATGPLTVKDAWSSSYATTKNTSFAATLNGSGIHRGVNNTVRGTVAITAEVPNADVGRYLNSSGLSGQLIINKAN